MQYNPELREIYLKNRILQALTLWLEPLNPNRRLKTLPNRKILEETLKIIAKLPVRLLHRQFALSGNVNIPMHTRTHTHTHCIQISLHDEILTTSNIFVFDPRSLHPFLLMSLPPSLPPSWLLCPFLSVYIFLQHGPTPLLPPRRIFCNFIAVNHILP